MAGSILRLAAYDLRRFRDATSGVERQLYLDAYDWIRANDYSWPFAFVNICQSLNLEPEAVREEVFGDQSLGLFGYCVQRCGRATRKFQIFLSNIFTNERNANAVEPGAPAPAVH
jgi:hypothetical protein